MNLHFSCGSLLVNEFSNTRTMLFTSIQCDDFCLDPLHLFNLYLSPGSSFLIFYVFTLTVLSFRVFTISFSSTSFDKGFLGEIIHVNNTLLPRKVVVYNLSFDYITFLNSYFGLRFNYRDLKFNRI